VLPFKRLWYGEPNPIANAIGYAKHRSRSHNAVIRVYAAAGNVIETHEHAGEFKEPSSAFSTSLGAPLETKRPNLRMSKVMRIW